jgi:hypothetical protein
MMREYIPEEHVFHILRGHLLNYIRGFRGASMFRSMATGVDSEEDLENILGELEKQLDQEMET